MYVTADMNALAAMLEDPAIKAMTEQLTQDPAFMEMAAQMQSAMLSGEMGGLSLAGEGGAGGMGAGGMGGMMEMMGKMMENPAFMNMAENLGKSMMSNSMDPESMAMIELFSNPANQEKLKSKMEELKDDPELGEMIKDIKENGQGAMMKYMQDPTLMSKMGKRFQEMMEDEEFASSLKKGGEEEGDESDGEEPGQETTVISAASNGSVDRLKQLIKDGADVNEKDEEGRSALQFAAGYGEIECMEVLLEAGADIDAVDENKNTAAHYSAGYGNVESVSLLKKKGADLSLKNEEGKTAKEVAEMNEQDEVVKLLA